jgi:hypothetical protein
MDLSYMLLGYNIAPTNHLKSKASLLETLSRLTSLFTLEDDLYRGTRLLTKGIEPSEQMSGWCYRTLVDINHWFSAVCSSYGLVYNSSILNRPIHIGPQLNRSKYHNRLDSEFDIGHYLLDGWEDDFRSVEIIENEDANIPDEVATQETIAVLQSGFAVLTRSVSGKDDKSIQVSESISARSSTPSLLGISINDALVGLFASISNHTVAAGTMTDNMNGNEDGNDDHRSSDTYCYDNEDDEENVCREYPLYFEDLADEALKFAEEMDALNPRDVVYIERGAAVPATEESILISSPINDIVNESNSELKTIDHGNDGVMGVEIVAAKRTRPKTTEDTGDVSSVDSDKPDKQAPRINMLSTDRNVNAVGPVVMTDLIWDTGASEHLFEKLPANYRNLRDKDCGLLLGGSAEHKLKIHKVFDVGCLRTVMLVDRTPQDRVGYDIISAGRLRHLRTVQCSRDSFYVVDTDNYTVSGGVIGSDTIFNR